MFEKNKYSRVYRQRKQASNQAIKQTSKAVDDYDGEKNDHIHNKRQSK